MNFPSLYEKGQSINRFYRYSARTPKGVLACYRPSNLEQKNFQFDHFRVLWFYHLIRFGYFDMETAQNIFSVVCPGKKFPSSWFYSVVGNRNFPISAYPSFFKKAPWQEGVSVGGRNNRRKVYYINKRFAIWFMSEFEQSHDLRQLIKVTEYENSMYSLSVNKLLGGKPSSVIVHDLNVRLLTSSIAKTITLGAISKTRVEDMNIQFSFPVDRLRISVVPDAALFVMGNVYHIEYDRTNEHHKRLLGKVIGYSEEEYYKGTTTFFIFESQTQLKRLQTRIQNFMMHVVSFRYSENQLLTDCLHENKVSIFVSNVYQSVNQISKIIMLENHLIDNPLISPNYLNEEFIIPDKVVEVIRCDLEDFNYILTIEDELSELEYVPFIFIHYLEVDVNIKLETLYQKYKSEYSRIFLAFDKEIEFNLFVPVRNNYFQTIYI